MAQLVLLVVAGITGLIVYSEVAKIERRFSRGPMGVPAFAWGFVGLIGAALVGQFVGAEVVVGGLIGFVAYSESAKYEKQSGAVPWGIPPLAWGVGCASLGLMGALVEPTFPIWLVVGFVGYREAAMYETQYDKPAVRVPALAWGVVGFFFGLVGGIVVCRWHGPRCASSCFWSEPTRCCSRSGTCCWPKGTRWSPTRTAKPAPGQNRRHLVRAAPTYAISCLANADYRADGYLAFAPWRQAGTLGAFGSSERR